MSKPLEMWAIYDLIKHEAMYQLYLLRHKRDKIGNRTRCAWWFRGEQ